MLQRLSELLLSTQRDMDDLERELAPIEDLESDNDSFDDCSAKEIKGSKLPLANPMLEGELQRGYIHFCFLCNMENIIA